MRVTLMGLPKEVGGANSEAGHTALLWRRAGIEVGIVPTWDIEPDNPWTERLLAAGCRIHEATPETLANVSGLRDGIAVAFSNSHACQVWDTLQAIGCRVVYSPCMCRPATHERRAFAAIPPAAVHFQSEYQAGLLGPFYATLGLGEDRQHLIRGAFDLSLFPFMPRPRSKRQFVVGRLARPVRTKWHPRLWTILGAVRHRGIALEAACQGWGREVEWQCGVPPEWAECMPPDLFSPQEFLAGCHSLLCANGGDPENWPRVGLEAMAAGVPVVAERQWGWPEMIEDGVTGLLYSTQAECIEHLTRLANDEPFRLSVIDAAREAVERLADPDRLAEQWQALLWSVERAEHTAGHYVPAAEAAAA